MYSLRHRQLVLLLTLGLTTWLGPLLPLTHAEETTSKPKTQSTTLTDIPDLPEMTKKRTLPATWDGDSFIDTPDLPTNPQHPNLKRKISKEQREALQKKKNWFIEGMKQKKKEAADQIAEERVKQEQDFINEMMQEEQKRTETARKKLEQISTPGAFTPSLTTQINTDSLSLSDSGLKFSAPGNLHTPSARLPATSNFQNPLLSSSSTLSKPGVPNAPLGTGRLSTIKTPARTMPSPGLSTAKPLGFKKLSSDPNFKPLGYGNSAFQAPTNNLKTSRQQQTSSNGDLSGNKEIFDRANPYQQRRDNRPSYKDLSSNIRDPNDLSFDF